MLSFTGGLKVFLAVEPCDLRKSFNGLHAIVTETLGENPRNAVEDLVLRRHGLMGLHKTFGGGHVQLAVFSEVRNN